MNPRLLHALLPALVALALPAAPAAESAPRRMAPALVRISAADVEAQSPDATSARSSAPPRITARVAVMETTGVPVTGLGADAFAVSEDGKPVKNVTVESAASSAEPLAVVLALDTSGSMAEVTQRGARLPLEDLRDAAITFLNTLGPSDSVAAFGFGGSVPRLEWNPDRNAVYATVHGFTASGFTPLWDAAFAAVALAADQPAGRRAVLVMSDGEDCGNDPCTKPGSVKTLDDVIRLAQDRNTPVFAVALGSKAQASGLQRLAETTGGLFLAASQSAELPARFTEVANAFRQEYVLRFEGQPRNEASEREMAVTVSLRGDTATATRRYQAPHTIARRVELRITTPEPEQHIRGEVPLEAAVTPNESARSVEYFVNDKPLGVATTAPWTVLWTPKGMPNGDYRLRARATGVDGVAVEQEILVLLRQPDRQAPWAATLGGVLLVLGAVGAAIAAGMRRRANAQAAAVAVPAAVTIAPVWQPAPEPVLAGAGAGYAPATGSAGTAAMLIEVSPDGERFPWPLGPGETLIGREVSAPHILLTDPDVSRLHGAIRFEGEQARYEEFSPTNPARINGRPYAGPWPLADGDEIQIGETRLIFRMTGEG